MVISSWMSLASWEVAIHPKNTIVKRRTDDGLQSAILHLAHLRSIFAEIGYKSAAKLICFRCLTCVEHVTGSERELTGSERELTGSEREWFIVQSNHLL